MAWMPLGLASHPTPVMNSQSWDSRINKIEVWMPWLTSKICEKIHSLGTGFSWRFSVDQYPLSQLPPFHDSEQRWVYQLCCTTKISTCFSNGNGLRLGQRHFRCSHSVDNLAKCGELPSSCARQKHKKHQMRSLACRFSVSSWWFQPPWKICSSKWESSPRIGVKINWKTTT